MELWQGRSATEGVEVEEGWRCGCECRLWRHAGTEGLVMYMCEWCGREWVDWLRVMLIDSWWLCKVMYERMEYVMLLINICWLVLVMM